MGTDCDIIIDNMADTSGVDLDRWYIFSDEFKSGEYVWAGCAIDKLKKLKRDAYKKGYRDCMQALHWVNVATGIINQTKPDTVKIIHEHDIDYSLATGGSYSTVEDLFEILPISGLESKPLRKGVD